jgi:Rrf2 family transcriptional regulator, iron-sulfur cluster assembly transcription factor
MKLGTKARYAVMAMVDLARHEGTAPVPLGEIAERQGISLLYLEQIFSRLRRAGLVEATRGPHGGFGLARQAAELRIADIVLAVEEDIRVTRCEAGSPEGCMADKARCLTHDLWEELGRQIFLFLSSVTLEDVSEGRLLGAARLFAPEPVSAASAPSVTSAAE